MFNVDQPAPRLERLEARRLLTDGGSAVLAPDGTLTVTGTDGDDSIALEGWSYAVTLNGTLFNFELTHIPIRRAIVEGFGGDDLIGVGENFGYGAQVTVIAGAGNDTISIFDNTADVDGGTGDDTVKLWFGAKLSSYTAAGGFDTFDLTNSHPEFGPISVDLKQYPTVKNVIGAQAAVFGNDLDNYITLAAPPSGFSFVRLVMGGGGNDTIVGGGYAHDYFDGGDGDDTFFGGFTVVGGSGSDTMDYSSLPVGITVDLSKGFSELLGLEKPLIGIENVIGGDGDDLIIGNSANNVLVGGAGNDTLIGNGGKDILFGGDGDDLFLSRDKKKDLIFGGDGDDTAIADKKDKLFDVEVVQAKNNGKRKGHS